MVTRKTQKVSKAGKGTVLKVDTASKVPQLEKLLKSGKITIVLIYADWCGHCHTFKKNVWGPACNKPAKNNLAEVNETVLPQTSLANVNISGYPSVLLIRKDGPEGNDTSAIRTPKSPEELSELANLDVSVSKTATQPPIKSLPFMNMKESPPLLTVQASAGEGTRAAATPAGATYEPAPLGQPQKGGNMIQMLDSVERTGVMPPLVMKALRSVLQGGGKKRRSSKTQKRKRFIRA